MQKLYNFLFPIAFTLASPYYFYRLWRRGDWKRGFGQRFGRYDSKLKQALTNRDVLLMHAVSVGEANVCVELIKELEPLARGKKIVVTTTTTTGMKVLERKLPPHISHIYFPVDFDFAVSRCLRSLNPEAVVLIEAEIWPNFMRKLRKRRIPAFLVNARISDRSFKGYQRASSLFRPLFQSFAGVGVQSEKDRRRLVDLGCRAEAVQVMGSLKFDSARLDPATNFDVDALLAQVGVAPGQRVFLAASTHAGEEEIAIRVARRLREQDPSLFTVIAPRHFERGKEVGDRLEALGVSFAYRSQLRSDTRLSAGAVDTLLLNTTGELKHFYPRATCAFIGKSLAGRGGQNPIEPAALRCPVLFGPHMDNFREIAAQLVENQAAVMAADENELASAALKIIADDDFRESLIRNASQVVENNQGGARRTAKMIADAL